MIQFNTTICKTAKTTSSVIKYCLPLLSGSTKSYKKNVSQQCSLITISNHQQRRMIFTKTLSLCSNSGDDMSGSGGGISSSSGSIFQQSDAGIKAYKNRQEWNSNHENKSSHSTANDSCHSSLDTILSHAGLSSSSSSSSSSSPSLNEALCPPLHLETTYTRPPSGDYYNTNEGGQGLIYARMGNPTRQNLEDVMSLLETSNNNNLRSSLDEKEIMKGEETTTKTISCAFSSGMAAISSILFALSNNNNKNPLHLLLPDDLYHGLPTQMKSIFTNDDHVRYSTIDMTNMNQIQNEINEICESQQRNDNDNDNDNNTTSTKKEEKTCTILIWMESPSNPLCKVTDIQKVCDWVESFRASDEGQQCNVDVYTAVDSTWAPSCITQPVRRIQKIPL